MHRGIVAAGKKNNNGEMGKQGKNWERKREDLKAKGT